MDIKDVYFRIPFISSASPKVCGGQAICAVCGFFFWSVHSPQVFIKVLAPVLTLLRFQGMPIIEYLENLLLKNWSTEALAANREWAMKMLRRFGWIFNLQKSVLHAWSTWILSWTQPNPGYFFPRNECWPFEVTSRSFALKSFLQSKFARGYWASWYRVVVVDHGL